MSREFHKLRVSDTSVEIDGGAKSISFELQAEQREDFRWFAGQHITLRFSLNGEEVRRSYSISSSPDSGDPLRITVKRVKDGLVSNHINDTVQPGDCIDVMTPFGSFYLKPGEKLRRTHYLIGAGSGITPLFSMLHSVLYAEPYSVVHLLYGNRDEKSIIFKDILDKLETQYPDRLTVSHVLSRNSVRSELAPWSKGIIDKNTIVRFISEYAPYAQDTQYYVCGPGNMNTTVRSSLMGLDVPGDRIHIESYGGAVDVDESVKGISTIADITLNRDSHNISVLEDQTILQAALDAGLKPPYSCQSGVCGACRATLHSGTVHMRARIALEDQEIEKGAILTCQSVATSEKLKIIYD